MRLRSRLDEGEQGPTKPKALHRWLAVGARLLVFGLLIFWFFKVADLEAFAEAFRHISPIAFLPAFVGAALINTIGGVRWRVLMGAFGARDLPGVWVAVRLFFVGLFYNTFVPGAFGGDVLRGVVTRRYFDKAAASYMVVFLERVIGFSAMIIVFLLGVALGPQIIDLHQHLPWLLAVLALGIIITAVALFSGRISSHLRNIPQIHRPYCLFWVFVLSLISHFAGITVMYILAVGMALPLQYVALIEVMPVAFAAAVIPLNVLGIGTREVTLVALLPRLGLGTEQVVALSLCYAAVHLGMAAVGGAIQLIQGRVGSRGLPAADRRV